MKEADQIVIRNEPSFFRLSSLRVPACLEQVTWKWSANSARPSGLISPAASLLSSARALWVSNILREKMFSSEPMLVYSSLASHLVKQHLDFLKVFQDKYIITTGLYTLFCLHWLYSTVVQSGLW